MNSSPNTSVRTPSYKSITELQALIPIDTPALFSSAGLVSTDSPLDQFIANAISINKIYLNAPSPLQPELGSLVVLGYMSAVESFFRTLVRRLVNLDEHTRLHVLDKRLSYGAALHYTHELLPDALLEDISFAGKNGMDKLFTELLGLKGPISNEVKTTLDEFYKICELRHCCVHRFGKLGSSNAIKLGLKRHSSMLEKPFSPTATDLEYIADSLRTFVKTVNNYLFQSVIERSAAYGKYKGTLPLTQWHWLFKRDGRKFRPYYELFASQTDTPPSPPMKDVYYSFRGAVRT